MEGVQRCFRVAEKRGTESGPRRACAETGATCGVRAKRRTFVSSPSQCVSYERPALAANILPPEIDGEGTCAVDGRTAAADLGGGRSSEGPVFRDRTIGPE